MCHGAPHGLPRLHQRKKKEKKRKMLVSSKGVVFPGMGCTHSFLSEPTHH